MPAKNTLKPYVENSYYHLYNRGVEKRIIFQDEQDYSVMLSYLKTYLLPKEENKLRTELVNPQISYKERDKILKLLLLNNFSDEITLISYCLMPNHFHFLIKQKSETGIDRFMRSLCTRYTMFFNRKYKRVGPLYQTAYKAVLVDTEEQLLQLTKYIHRNPLGENFVPKDQILSKLYSQPSSLPEYLGERNTDWVHGEEILAFFSKTNSNLSYKTFIGQTEDISLIGEKIIDY